MTKQALRTALKEKRRALAPQICAALSCKTVENVLSWCIYSQSTQVLTYWPFGGEVDLRALHAQSRDKQFFLPKVRPGAEMDAVAWPQCGQWKPNRFGILEPDGPAAEKAGLDLVLVPALGCDPAGNRLGFGAGYYDRYLADCPAVRAAVLYEFQLVANVPAQPHDIRMDYIITPDRIIKCEECT